MENKHHLFKKQLLNQKIPSIHSQSLTLFALMFNALLCFNVRTFFYFIYFHCIPMNRTVRRTHFKKASP